MPILETHERCLLDVELSLMAQQIQQVLERAVFAQGDGSRPITAAERDRCRVLAERVVRQTSELALTLASAKANCALRDLVNEAETVVRREGFMSVPRALQEMNRWATRFGADRIVSAYEQELSR